MANNSLTHVNQIEGLISEVHNHLEAISPQTAEQAEVKAKAMNRLNAWQTNQLFELRKIFEENPPTTLDYRTTTR